MVFLFDGGVEVFVLKVIGVVCSLIWVVVYLFMLLFVMCVLFVVKCCGVNVVVVVDDKGNCVKSSK